MNFITNPEEIEKKSFEIITEKLAGRQFDSQNENVIKRVIHSTADFDYADNLCFSDNAVSIARDALQNGARIVTDTQMAKAGINKKALKQIKCSVHCFIDAQEVVETAQAAGITRARAAVDRAIETLEGSLIFVVGNAPTALIRLHELISSQLFIPAMVVAVPVGFVNVTESKELILELPVPYIVARGQKGGSNVAAAICNALLYETTGRSI
jgi:precorrin-8X/cobalt-precorrin-8 methylmutase